MRPKFHIRVKKIDAERLKLATDYWQLRDDGKWQETVEQVATRHGLKPTEIIARVREVVTVYDLSTRCNRCDSPRELASRSSRTRTYGSYSCAACEKALSEERWQAHIEKQQNARRRNEELLTRTFMPDARLDYDSLNLGR